MVREHINRRTFVRAAGTAGTIGIAGLAGCAGDGGDGGGGDGGDGGDGGSTGTPGGDALVIGNAAPLSGPQTPWGQTHQAGLEFAAREINADGGIDGRDVRIESQDTGGDPQEAATAFRRLVDNQGAVAVSGPVLSSVGIRVREVAEEEQVPHIPNLAASANLLTKETRYTFRLAGVATAYIARGAAGYIEENGWTNYGAIIADYAYGHSYQEALEQYITSMDGLDATVEVAPMQADDYTSQLRQMPDDIEFLDVAGHPIGIYTIVEQALDLGLEPEAMTGPTIPSGQFYSTLGDTVAEGLMTFPPVDVTKESYTEVANRYYDATDEFFDPFVSFGWDTVNLVAAAIEESGDASPGGIRDGLSEVEYDTILAFPQVSYNEWGELEESKLFGQKFTLEAPDYYPDGDYGFENVYETDVYGPVDPDEWGN